MFVVFWVKFIGWLYVDLHDSSYFLERSLVLVGLVVVGSNCRFLRVL